MVRLIASLAPLALALDLETHPHSHKAHKKDKKDDLLDSVEKVDEVEAAKEEEKKSDAARLFQDLEQLLAEEPEETASLRNHIQIGAEHTSNHSKSMNPNALIPNVFNKVNVPNLKCSDGSEYYFLVVPALRPGTQQIETEKIAIEFMGSGACVTSGTCKPQCGDFASLMHDCSDVSVSFLRMAVNRYVGKSPFALAKKPVGFIPTDENHPLAKHTNVYITYCTSDAHLGDAVAPVAGGWHFEGAKNARYVIDWTNHMFPETKELFIHGGSAGAIAVPQWAPTMTHIFNKAQVRTHADSGLFFVPGTKAWHNFMAKMPWGFPNKQFEVSGHPVQTPRTMMTWYLDRAEQYKSRLTQAWIEASYDFNEWQYNHKFLKALNAETEDDALSEPNTAKAVFLNTMHQHAPKGNMYFRVNSGKIHYVTRGEWYHKDGLEGYPGAEKYSHWLDKYVNGNLKELPTFDVNPVWMSNATNRVNMLQHRPHVEPQTSNSKKGKKAGKAMSLEKSNGIEDLLDFAY